MKYYIDNFYQSYRENKWLFRHVFTPCSLHNGKNSSYYIKLKNGLKFPAIFNGLKDQTKNELYLKKETI